MYFVEILGSKSKQQNNKNFNEIALIFRHPSIPSTGAIHQCHPLMPSVASISHLSFRIWHCRMSKNQSYFIKILVVLLF